MMVTITGAAAGTGKSVFAQLLGMRFNQTGLRVAYTTPFPMPRCIAPEAMDIFSDARGTLNLRHYDVAILDEYYPYLVEQANVLYPQTTVQVYQECERAPLGTVIQFRSCSPQWMQWFPAKYPDLKRIVASLERGQFLVLSLDRARWEFAWDETVYHLVYEPALSLAGGDETWKRISAMTGFDALEVRL